MCLQAGQKYPMEILMECGAGDGFYACIMIEKKYPATPYPKRYACEVWPQDAPVYAYPVFALSKGIPIPPYVKSWGSSDQVLPEN